MDEKEEMQRRIYELMTTLASTNSVIGDWKVVKCYEFFLQGLEPPYDVNELHQKRQAVRDEIDQLKKKLTEAAS